MIPPPYPQSWGSKDNFKSPKLGEARTVNLSHRKECRGFRGHLNSATPKNQEEFAMSKPTVKYWHVWTDEDGVSHQNPM